MGSQMQVNHNLAVNRPIATFASRAFALRLLAEPYRGAAVPRCTRTLGHASL